MIDAHNASNNVYVDDDRILQTICDKQHIHVFHVVFSDQKIHASKNTSIDDNKIVVYAYVFSARNLYDSICM